MTPCLACQGPLRLLLAIDRDGTPHGVVPREVIADLEPAPHNFQFSYSAVFECGTCGRGDLRALYHDCFQPPWEEEWDSERSAEISPSDLAHLRDGLVSCPHPTRFDCDCAAHTGLREGVPLGTSVPDVIPDPFPRTTLGVRLNEAGVPEFVR